PGEGAPAERIRAWQERLAELLQPLPSPRGPWFEAEGLDPLSELLIRFTHFRIESLGPNQALMTRMMPPRSTVFRDQLLDTLEGRLDALLRLRESGDVDAEAFARGLEAVADDIYLSSVIDVLGSLVEPRAEGADDTDFERDPAAWIRGFDAQYEQAQGSTRERLGTQREQMRERLRKLDALRPGLRALLRELER
ncbi:MAG: hypothetical protein OEY14_17780, partial [Myxococcales bacterium]|nr:hypothetical protein [Myxococcales bacterium]